MQYRKNSLYCSCFRTDFIFDFHFQSNDTTIDIHHMIPDEWSNCFWSCCLWQWLLRRVRLSRFPSMYLRYIFVEYKANTTTTTTPPRKYLCQSFWMTKIQNGTVHPCQHQQAYIFERKSSYRRQCNALTEWWRLLVFNIQHWMLKEQYFVS